MSAGNNLRPLEELGVLLTADPSHQSLSLLLKLHICCTLLAGFSISHATLLTHYVPKDDLEL